VNSWERAKLRDRLLLLGIVACVLGLFALIYGTPQGFERITSVFRSHNSQSTFTSPEPAAQTPQQRPAKKTTARVRSGAAAPIPEETGDSAYVKIVIPKDPPRSPADLAHANVKSDAQVYSFNSPNSNILRTLKKGDRVETNLEVIDSKGHWTLVRTNELRRTGFVRTENLERQDGNDAHNDAQENNVASSAEGAER